MAIVICGLQRSGTTMLMQVLSSHPEIGITEEFGNFSMIGRSFRETTRHALRRWWNTHLRSLKGRVHGNGPYFMLNNLWWMAVYLSKLYKYRDEKLSCSHIEYAMRAIFPKERLVGDKHPDYSYDLDRLAQLEGLKIIMIYRDPRDVVSSILEKSRGEWKRWWPDDMRNASGVANRWVEVTQNMRKNANKILIISYERLVREPAVVLNELGAWIQVDPEGFHRDIIRTTSIGKHHQGLTRQEVETVNEITAALIRTLGYRV